MNQKQKSKLTMLLAGLASRYSENELYFEQTEIKARSGNKDAAGKIIKKYDVLTLSLAAQTHKGDMPELLQKLTDMILGYDTAEIIYRERGRQITIIANDKEVKSTFAETPSSMDVKTPDSREYYIKADRAAPLLCEMGILTKDGKIKNDMLRKYSQIDHFIEMADAKLRTLSADREITVVDAACGKSYLSFALNYYMREELKLKCKFIGLDISEKVIEASKESAKRLNYANMSFVKADICEYKAEKTDILISLHACDIATDMAIAFGINSGAKLIMCVPCCHKELLNKFNIGAYEPLKSHGIMKKRLNDIITDALRIMKMEACGYKVTADEYVSPTDTPKNLLITAEYTGKANSKAAASYEEMLKLLQVTPTMEKLIR